MATRRSRPPRARKARASDSQPPPNDVLVERVFAEHPSDLPPAPPSLAEELALLDEGWDETVA